MKSIAATIALSFLLIFTQFHGYSQVHPVFEKFGEFRKSNYQEKIYVSTDREFYLAGEIIWFKVYGLDGSMHLPSDVSRIGYVELLGADSVIQLQAKVELNEGCGSGSFYIPTSINSGRFVLRAYTNWMKNYDESFFFQKELTIVNTFRQLPPRSSIDSIDLQFYPEGGHLVAGLESRVAFQATHSKGKNAEFEGTLVDSRGDTVLNFSPQNDGMRSFTFVPENDVSYRAVLVSGEDTYYAPLPEVEEFGYVLSLESQDEQVALSVNTNTRGSGVFLLIHSRNIVSHSIHKNLDDGNATFNISKKELAAGVNHLTIFNDANIPVAERLFFKQPDNLMSIDIKQGQNAHSVKEKVSYRISAINAPKASLSMSVYKLDSLNKEPTINIVNYLYLQSDLRGYIINPSQYIGGKVPEKDVDLLMMVHGWSRFSWDEVLEPVLSDKEYVPELRGHLIQGNVFHKEDESPAPHVIVYLSVLGEHPRFYISRSDAQGRIKFELQDSYGTADIVVSTNELLDSLYRIELKDPFSTEINSFSNHELNVNEDLSGPLIARSIDMQTLNVYQEEHINAYNATDSDTSFFYMNADKRYLLDDFTRFSSMEDIMREYMPEVYVTSNRQGFGLRILDKVRQVKYEDNPLILYDGVPVFDVNKFMAVDPHSIKSMDIIRKRYFYNKGTFDGIISCSSYGRDLAGLDVDPSALLLNYEFAQKQRAFYSPDHSRNTSATTPDRRNLLFWSADIVTNEQGVADVEFFTSEETGKYLVVIEGMSANGIPGFTTFSFEVVDEVN